MLPTHSEYRVRGFNVTLDFEYLIGASSKGFLFLLERVIPCIDIVCVCVCVCIDVPIHLCPSSPPPHVDVCVCYTYTMYMYMCT